MKNPAITFQGVHAAHTDLACREAYPDMAKLFITLEGHTRERNVQLALDELEYFCDTVDIIGTYQAAP